jgi:hypothetical protein
VLSDLQNDDAAPLRPADQLKIVFEVMTLALMEGVQSLLELISDPGEDISIGRFEKEVDPDLNMMAEIRRERAERARDAYLARVDLVASAKHA